MEGGPPRAKRMKNCVTHDTEKEVRDDTTGRKEGSSEKPQRKKANAKKGRKKPNNGKRKKTDLTKRKNGNKHGY